ncbi:MAG: prolyl-tRNA synthetase associated domain-containing protein [Ruminococcaceae bacterium]|nr:prolyl-tRNA synthetase associated domain-containing protein [Oscillospiraceae bacterium]
MNITKLTAGRPENMEDRLERERRCYEFLDDLQITYDRVDHDPAQTMEDCTLIDVELGTRMCKNLFLCNRQQTDFYLLMIPGDKVFKTKDLSAQLGTSRLSFAGPEHMELYLDILPGAVSVLGLMNDTENKVRLLVDADLLGDAYVGCHPCVNTSSLRIKRDVMFDKIVPAMGHDMTVVTLPVYPTEA